MRHGSTRRNLRIAHRALPALVALGVASAATAATDANVVRAVEVGESADGTEIRVVGTAEPTYTVFKLAEPARLVVDISGTDLSGVERLLEVNRGNVEAVLTTQFDDAGARVGRVMVALKADVPYDVRAVGNDVVITVERAEGSATDGAAAPMDESHAAEAEGADADDAEPEVEVAAAPEPAPPTPRIETPAETPAAAKPAVAERTSDESLPEGVVARRIDRLPGTAAAGSRVLGIRTRTVGRTTVVGIRTDAPPAAVETLELVDPPRLAVDLHGVTAAPRRANVQGLAGSDTVKNVRIGRHADMVRVVVDGKGTSMGEYEVERTRSGVAVRVSRAVASASVASAPAAKSAGPEGYVRALTYSRSGEVGRVVVGMDNASSVKYRVSQPDARTAVLTLLAADLDQNLEQTFDASRHGGAVQAVTAFTDPSEPDRVKIVATLSEPVKSRIVPMRGGLSWEFDVGAVVEIDAADIEDETELADAESEEIPVIQAAGLSSEGAVHVASSGERQRKVYRGRRVNLEFKEIDIHNVLRLIAEVSKRNIVVADDVSGKVTLRLRNVPWDQALDLVLKSKGLGKEVSGNIIRVAPADQLAKEREARLAEMESRRKLEPLRVRLVAVNFAMADEMQAKVKDVLTERGSVTVDKRTNSLIIKDVVAALARAEKLVRRLDSETPQVLIESRIVEANTNFSREAGIQWGGNVVASPAFGNPTGLVFPNIVSMAGAADDSRAPISATAATPNFVVNMPAPIGINSGAGLGFIFGSAGGAVNLNLRLSALENEGVIKTISAPKVTTLDNEQATISQGLSIPFSQVSAAGVNTTFIQAKLQLDVTPHVTADGSILMDVSVTNNQPNPQLTGANGQPSISQKEAKTTVMVKDGDTTVIGGIYTRQNSESYNRVPGLSRIPVLGWLFKKKVRQDQRTELLVFITPRIVNRAASRPGG